MDTEETEERESDGGTKSMQRAQGSPQFTSYRGLITSCKILRRAFECTPLEIEMGDFDVTGEIGRKTLLRCEETTIRLARIATVCGLRMMTLNSILD